MKIDQKGYCRIIGPDGIDLGVQKKTRDEAYEYITEVDKRLGVFTIKQSDYICTVRVCDQSPPVEPPPGDPPVEPPIEPPPIDPPEPPMPIGSAPPLHAEFVSRYTKYAEDTAANLASGPAGITDSSYAENGSRTAFYSCYPGLVRAKQRGDRTGDLITLNPAGLQKALEIQLVRWASPTKGAGAWHRAADVPYTAIIEGATKGWMDGNPPVDAADFEEHLYGSSGANNFSRSFLSEFGAGAKAGTQAGRDIGNTGSNFQRAAALLGIAAVLHEKLGNPRAMAPRDAPHLTIDWCFRGAINHCHMWMKEFTNLQTSQGVQPDYADSTAMYLMPLTINFLHIAYRHFEAIGEDPNQYFPARILNGDYLGDGQSQPVIDNPYLDTVDVLGQTMDFFFGPINGAPVIDTTPYSQTEPYVGGYARVNAEHTIATRTFSVGDPMVWKHADGTWRTFGRSNGVGRDRDFNTNLQMENVLGLMQAADLYHGTDNARRDKYIRWGDEIFKGAVTWAMQTPNPRQKVRNQNLYGVYEALDLRNAMLGRND